MGQPKGCTPWNKGKSGYLSIHARKKLSKAVKGKSGAKALAWKGGRYESQGYVFVYAPKHPRVKKSARNYLFEHILVAEQKLGRHLKKGEVVHHVNGKRNDNRPENLVVLTRAQHCKLHNPHNW